MLRACLQRSLAAWPRRARRSLHFRAPRSCASLAAVEDTPPEWFAVRQPATSSSLDLAAAVRQPAAPDESRDSLELAARLEFADAASLAKEALLIAYNEVLRPAWPEVAKKLKSVELDAIDALLILHCMVKIGASDRDLLMKLADNIEGRFFSMEMGLPDLDILDLFPHEGSFQSLVRALPVDHKVKLILGDHFSRHDGKTRAQPQQPPTDVKMRWKTMDPVDMEAWEKQRFEEGRIRVARMRYVQARVTKMQPGKKLRATLAADFLRQVPAMCLKTLTSFSQLFAMSKGRVLRGDLQEDLQEKFARRVAQLDTHQVMPLMLAFMSAMRTFEGPEAVRTWRSKLTPALVRLAKLREKEVFKLLDCQRGFHPNLDAARLSISESSTKLSQLQHRAHRAAQLYTVCCSARVMTMDCQLHDALVTPLCSLIVAWTTELATSPEQFTGPHQRVLLPLELIADMLDAAVACGLGGSGLSRELVKLLHDQYSEDIVSKRLELSKYTPRDISATANGLAVLNSAPDSDTFLDLLWRVARPQLKSMEPHVVLMLLNAIMRGGSNELVSSTEFGDAVDEHLVQKIDFDSQTLGFLG